ncbi:hypothetical protein COS31_03555 [Candidatus Roizmanbacteria bacterium CG02_land_8_20_14_3_00_36_15]|uniref:LysM domain-containing protein n=1 Tax=Candidatus Roizmanbacteria bacterium CG10_big_fil_rev_8_21_14_0_10_36_26 TaxID=1974851 RepID=A0A2M8KMJ4_9BACT|nr:MAG: hypothetical protein COS51_03765 [Candidatus Roizmanbacteria bacterium CG03_land_8_20_14_0_80_36_21]PIV37639.1 MAG: hypothetical protein COS31_03555 [Candidatus Roizmanbacteria bacterium CG02_land_8_20_14_3_00_36_15]PIY69948.1 MAG: hypothetical protein COY89_03795 [Candidatus Roizmanbacteria bacterium CG_4_10_14_0_8_um_filter_36_36]PJA53048.1 MAG: hypothetical protein CO166_03170 [Candidatus Roizmanbacteria bacterium CG_4_9_14_3_um_filter_36_11]PJE61135.1 MAG: hypothetical protein COU86
MYFILGLVIILIIIFSGIFSFSKKEIISSSKNNKSSSKTPSKINVAIYITQKGDYLWKIAEEAYGSGYNAYDIAIANKISNPNLIFSGTKLVLPNVTPKALTKGEIDQRSTTQVTQTNSKYIVKAGDYLWKIALESYGDGFAWVKIAKINNLNNPNIIEPGQVLIIPR